jgi:predicted nucleotidyltransferase
MSRECALVEAVHLSGSRVKGFALPKSDVDRAITTNDSNYTRFDVEWQTELAKRLDMRVRLSPIHVNVFLRGKGFRVLDVFPYRNTRENADPLSGLLLETLHSPRRLPPSPTEKGGRQ